MPTHIDNLNNIGADGVVIYTDDGRFFVIPEDQWRSQELDAKNAGEAGVLVKRGTVLARIPQEGPPAGYACILINLGSLKKPPQP